MLHASTKKLIDRLAEMTDLSKLDWTESESGQITYSTEGYSVALTEAPNEVVIFSKAGTELERATAEELAASHDENGTPYAEIVASMTNEASRVARGTEAAISTLLAGMQDAPTEAPAEPADTLQNELPEDPVDDTTVVEADSIATLPHEAEPEQEVAEETVAEAAPVEEHNPPADSESEVTEAVVKLADEVNQREETSLDAAAATAVGAVALAAGLTQTETEDDTPVETHDASEPNEAEAFIAAPEPAQDATEPPAYVPFGLNSDDQPVSTDPTEPLVSEPEPEMTSAQEIESEQITTQETVAEETVTEDIADPADDIEPTDLAASEPDMPIPAFTVDAAEPEAEEINLTSTPELGLGPEPEPEPEPAETAQFEDSPVANTLAAPVSFETPPAEPEAPQEPATEPPELVAPPTHAAPPAPEPIETAEEAAPANPAPTAQTYSLSGIGAGFGLGALSAKTEASGVPGPQTGGAGQPEKIVIDATEDHLPDVDGKPALPIDVAPIPGTSQIETAAQTEANREDTDPDILKPRTRFNPWD